MTSLQRSDILGLSVPERIQLVEDIWDSIADTPEAVPLSDAQKDELDRRLDSIQANPDSGSPWAIAKDRIRNRQ